MSQPKMKEVDIRVTLLDDKLDTRVLLHSIIRSIEDVYDIVELKNNGFGHLLPDESTRIVWENLAG